MAKSRVVFTYHTVEVSIVVEYEGGESDQQIVKQAQEELSFNVDIDVVHIGEWVSQVVPLPNR